MSTTETLRGFHRAEPLVPAGRQMSARAQFLVAGAVFLACLAPALINGFPVVFPDTESYLHSAFKFRPMHVRAFGYGAFIGVTGGVLSLWLTILAQAALSAWLVTRLIALESPRWPSTWWVPVTLSLVAVVSLSHLPWLAAWVQPDLFTGLMLLSLLLLVEHRESLGRAERFLLFGILVGCVTMHLTHPPLLSGLGVFALGALAVVAVRRGARGLVLRLRRTAFLALLAAALGWGGLGVANYITYKTFAGSLGGSVFLFARLSADGDVATTLRSECEAGKPWAACRHLDRFNLTADEFLWRPWSPLKDMGYVSGFMHEAAELNPLLVRQLWPEWLSKSAVRTVQQIVHFELGDGMDDEGTWTLGQDLPPWMRGDEALAARLSSVAAGVRDARQANDDLRPLMPRPPAETLAAVGLAALVGILVFGLLRRRPDVWWPALLFLVVYLGNAGLIALGGEVHHRYGARLVWVAPLLAGLLALRAACLADEDGVGRDAAVSQR